MRLSEAEVGKTYLIVSVEVNGNMKYVLYTHGLLPGMTVRVRCLKTSRNAMLVEIVPLWRLIAISKDIAKFLVVIPQS